MTEVMRAYEPPIQSSNYYLRDSRQGGGTPYHATISYDISLWEWVLNGNDILGNWEGMRIRGAQASRTL